MLCNRLTDVYQQRTRPAGRVINLDMVTMGKMIGNDFRHEQRDLVRRIELPCFLAGVGSELADEVLVDIAKNVVVLLAVHGNLIDEMDEVAYCLGL